MTHQRVASTENINRNETMAKKPLFREHDYCRAILTWKTEDRVFGKKFTRNTVDKWTDALLVRVHTGDDWNKFIDREFTIHKVQYSFLPEQQIRGKVYTKFGIPTVMGDVLSRAISTFSGSNSNDRLSSRRKNPIKMSHTKKSAKLKEVSELTRQDMQQIAELQKSRRKSHNRRKSIEPSRIVSIESEILQNSPSEFEFSQNTPNKPKFVRKLTPYYQPSNTQAVDSTGPSNASIYSVTTEVLTENSRLPDFQQTFGSLTPTNFSNCFPSLSFQTQNYPSLSTHEISDPEMIDEDLSDREQCITPESRSPVRVASSELHIWENSKLPELTPASFTLAETQHYIDPDDLSTQSLSLSFRNHKKSLITSAGRTPTTPRGMKRKADPESLWTDMEESCEPGSPIIELINNGISQLSTAGVKDAEMPRNLLSNEMREPESLWTNWEKSCETRSPIIDTTTNDIGHWSNVVVSPCSVSIGTSLSAPAFLKSRTQTVDTVDHDHCYDEKSNDSSPRNRDFDVLKLRSGRRAVNVSGNKSTKVRFDGFNGNDIDETTNVEDKQKNIKNKRKIDNYVNKENSPTTQLLCNDTSLLTQTSRLSLSDSNKSPATQSPEFPTPAEKKVRLRSPLNVHRSQKNGSSAIAGRKLTPFYVERKNTNRRTLTPFYASLGDADCRDSTTEKNAEKLRTKLTPYYSRDKNYETQVIDLTDSNEDLTNLTELAIDNIGSQVSRSDTKANIASPTALSNVEATIKIAFPLLKDKPVITTDAGSSTRGNSESSTSSRATATEYFSNFCCEYDNSCMNDSFGEILPYEPKLLKYLVKPTDDEITKNIDKALRILDTLDDDDLRF